jgi:hypothetical protein
VTENTIIIADWETVEYTVTFIGRDDNVVSEQQIAHGEAAQPPAPLSSANGMTFVGWSTNVEWWRVTENLTVSPIFMHENTAEAPMYDIEIGISGDYEDEFTEVVNIIRLNSSTPNATIYFSIEGGLFNEDDVTPNDTDFPFDFIYSEDEPIIVTDDVVITMIAVAENMNDSDIIEIELPFIDFEWEHDDYFLSAEESITVQPGDEIDIPVYISTLEGIVGNVRLGLNYNRDVLSLLGFAPGNGLVVEGLILLTTLEFQVAANAIDGEYPLVITPQATDEEGETIPIEPITVNIIVGEIIGCGDCGECADCDPCTTCTGICGQVCTHRNCNKTVPFCGTCVICLVCTSCVGVCGQTCTHPNCSRTVPSCGTCIICNPCTSCVGVCGQTCTHPNCSRTIPKCGTCANCKGASCACDKADCGICNEDGKWFALGDVNGDNKVDIFDALEVLKFIIKMNSTITHGDIQDGAMRAARISPNAQAENGEPNIFCALEILKFIIGMDSRVDGVRINGKASTE